MTRRTFLPTSWTRTAWTVWRWPLIVYMYLNQLKDEELYTANYSREEIVDGINSVCRIWYIGV